MGDGSVSGWMDIPVRFHRMQARKEMVRVYMDNREFFDAPAGQCRLLGVYAPGYVVDITVSK